MSKNFFVFYSIKARHDAFFISPFLPAARKVKAKGGILSLSDPKIWLELSQSLFTVFVPILLPLSFIIICVGSYFEKMDKNTTTMM